MGVDHGVHKQSISARCRGQREGGEYENKHAVRMATALLNVEDVKLRDLFSNGWRDPLVPVSVVGVVERERAGEQLARGLFAYEETGVPGYVACLSKAS